MHVLHRMGTKFNDYGQPTTVPIPGESRSQGSWVRWYTGKLQKAACFVSTFSFLVDGSSDIFVPLFKDANLASVFLNSQLRSLAVRSLSDSSFTFSTHDA